MISGASNPANTKIGSCERWTELIMHMLCYRNFINCSDTAEALQKKSTSNFFKSLLEIIPENCLAGDTLYKSVLK